MKERNTPNTLNREKSIFIRNHDNDLVNWNKWNEEVFTLAKEKGKLLFISIGFS